LQYGVNEAVTSVVSLAEVLVQPLIAKRGDLIQQYRNLLTGGPHLSLVDLTPPIAGRAADLRAKYGLRLPDAFQIAAAVERGASHFLTNNRRLASVSEMAVVILEDYRS
jgi:predicted nucleic acid-binding protein